MFALQWLHFHKRCLRCESWISFVTLSLPACLHDGLTLIKLSLLIILTSNHFMSFTPLGAKCFGSDLQCLAFNWVMGFVSDLIPNTNIAIRKKFTKQMYMTEIKVMFVTKQKGLFAQWQEQCWLLFL